ncbi:hypothetical protein B0T24DRAFT_427633 [Lasiosphaeria ovina]|uniref:Uncharacterized protein n=1 Tax=Lasiosphaeria ovina TaxID=92902 RepID=A0AAE0N008_9PEZI|nr:hypothetical protein B0T24DRAFT_427633 [Lasiosphaeria ovina]
MRPDGKGQVKFLMPPVLVRPYSVMTFSSFIYLLFIIIKHPDDYTGMPAALLHSFSLHKSSTTAFSRNEGKESTRLSYLTASEYCGIYYTSLLRRQYEAHTYSTQPPAGTRFYPVILAPRFRQPTTTRYLPEAVSKPGLGRNALRMHHIIHFTAHRKPHTAHRCTP